MSALTGDWPDFPVRPKHLAARLGIGDKAVRARLRAKPPVPHGRYDRWEFTPAQANEIVRGWR